MTSNAPSLFEFEGSVPGTPELVTVTGSRAYGLDRPDSDYDFRGFYSADPKLLLGLSKPDETFILDEPDVALHETAKFCVLALSGNPTALEALASDTVIHATDFGQILVDNQDAFLSNRLKARYSGFARSQMKRLARRLEGHGDDRRNKKLQLHMFRLLIQGAHTLETGVLNVRLNDSDKERLFELAAVDLTAHPEVAEAEFDKFDSVTSVLPDEPDVARVEQFIIEHRIQQLAG